mmetsp:Transcript_11083/g.41381  ORF Transcript_11083/g.41381 Transcript_11083/m.41381 type:complete len:584 (+) Transcript_11083:102-1853(+)
MSISRIDPPLSCRYTPIKTKPSRLTAPFSESNIHSSVLATFATSTRLTHTPTMSSNFNSFPQQLFFQNGTVPVYNTSLGNSVNRSFAPGMNIVMGIPFKPTNVVQNAAAEMSANVGSNEPLENVTVKFEPKHSQDSSTMPAFSQQMLPPGGDKKQGNTTKHTDASPPQSKKRKRVNSITKKTSNNRLIRTDANTLKTRTLSHDDFLAVLHLDQNSAAESLDCCLSSFKRSLHHLQPRMRWSTIKQRERAEQRSQLIKQLRKVSECNAFLYSPSTFFEFTGASSENSLSNLDQLFTQDTEIVLSTMGDYTSSPQLSLDSSSQPSVSPTKNDPRFMYKQQLQETCQQLHQENNVLVSLLQAQQELITGMQLSQRRPLQQPLLYKNIVPPSIMGSSVFTGDIHKLDGPWNSVPKIDTALLALFGSDGNIIACNNNYSRLIGRSFEYLSQTEHKITRLEICSHGERSALKVLKRMCSEFASLGVLQTIEFSSGWMDPLTQEIYCTKHTWHLCEGFVWVQSDKCDTFMDHVMVNGWFKVRKSLVKNGQAALYTQDDFISEDILLRSSLNEVLDFLEKAAGNLHSSGPP